MANVGVVGGDLSFCLAISIRVKLYLHTLILYLFVADVVNGCFFVLFVFYPSRDSDDKPSVS